MALGDTYATLDELKAYLSLTGQTAVDDQVNDALQSASREIERHCKRQFNKTTVASARTYAPDNYGLVRTDDFHTVTDLVVETDETGDGTFERTWTSADYELYPLNGVVEGQPGWPFWKVRKSGSLWFPVCAFTGHKRATVRVTAQWGWLEVPAPVKQACLILAAMAFKLKGAPLGVAGMGDFGVVRVRNNRMAEDKLNDYCRDKVLVG